MHKKIAVIFGDGIGPEVTQQSIKVLDAIARQFKHNFKYTYGLMGAVAIDKPEIRYLMKHLICVLKAMRFYLERLDIQNMIMILQPK